MRSGLDNLKLVLGIFDAIIGIPILGFMMVWTLWGLPLLLLIPMHTMSLILSKKYNKPITGPILGICASTIGIIPFIGMILHWMSAYFNINEADETILN